LPSLPQPSSREGCSAAAVPQLAPREGGRGGGKGRKPDGLGEGVSEESPRGAEGSVG